MIPRDEQPAVLSKAAELGIEVTAEDVVWPFPEDRGLSAAEVVR